MFIKLPLLQITKSYMGPLVEENVSLKKFNTFGIDVKASLFVNITTEKELWELLQSNTTKNQPLLVVGGGSNILFTQDFEGLVIKMSISGIHTVEQGNDIFITAGAGVVWNDLVMYAVNNEYAGLENLSLIPGTVGASPIQNIGAYGVELKDVFYSCKALEVNTGAEKEFKYEECAFGYRDSVFKRDLKGKYIITAVTFKLSKSPKLNVQYGAIQTELEKRQILQPSIADISSVVSEIRVSKLPDPSTIGNAGSFFKNPVIDHTRYEKLILDFPNVVSYPFGNDTFKIAAGWLIEQCGFKGMISGQTGTWKNQALVLVNHGSATGSEVYEFSEHIINTVEAKYEIRLEREVNIL
ncbi:MAG: UDP-N-acetylenolpyruvoylglucosamine reductase [Pedobacter sp.]|nr:UDP-N-acetylenolpyruvoylglucosamine reductase [Pedobacter sp.]